MKYRIVECDLGTLILFARTNRLSRLDLRSGNREEIETRLALEFPGATEAPEQFLDVEGLLQRYTKGDPVRFDVPVDLAELRPFTARVLTAIRKIPYGKTASYGTIARRLGHPKATRAVGQALHRNPIPIVIPCHRVVSGDGSLGGFGMGLDMKRKLLSLEGAHVRESNKSIIPSH